MTQPPASEPEGLLLLGAKLQELTSASRPQDGDPPQLCVSVGGTCSRSLRKGLNSAAPGGLLTFSSWFTTSFCWAYIQSRNSVAFGRYGLFAVFDSLLHKVWGLLGNCAAQRVAQGGLGSGFKRACLMKQGATTTLTEQN